MKSKFKVGQKVEIVGNIPFHLKNKPRPLLGTIKQIDGYYILVKPLYQRYLAEFYPSELKPINNEKDNASTVDTSTTK